MNPNYTKVKNSLTRLLVLFAVLLGFAQQSNAQATITVGAGATLSSSLTNYYVTPFSSYWHDGRHQYIITPAEIIAAGGYPGTITSLAFNLGGLPGQSFLNFDVKLGHYANSTFLASDPFSTNVTSVYSNANYTVPGLGWQTITFTNNFTWDGVSNLIVDVCFDNASYTSDGSVYCDLVATGNITKYQYTDGTAGCQFNGLGSPAGSYGIYNYRPQMRFTLLPNFACSGTPTPGATTSNLSGSAACPSTPITFGLSGIASLGSGVTYQWQSSSNNITYTDISGATSAGYTTNVTTNTYYRCVVTCTNSGLSANSAELFIPAAGAPMSGTYTINNLLATGGTNYASFSAAVADLICRGVAGPVTFNVNATSGPYTEQVTIPQIAGASLTNTITFNGNGRTLQYSSTASAQPWTLGLNGADFTRWNNLIVNGQGTTYALTVHLWNQADNNNFTSCTFNCPANGTGSTLVPFSISGSATSATTSGTSGSNNIVDGCTMFSGYYNTSIVGNSASAATGNIVRNSTMSDFYFYGAYVLYQNGFTLSNNLIHRPTRTTLSTFYGIYLSTGSTNCLVERNRIRNPFQGLLTSTSSFYGIYCLSSGTLNNENKIYNNLLSDINSNGILYGIYATSTYTKIYHNTLALNQTTSAATGVTYGIYSSGTLAVDIRNNDVNITRGGTGSKYCLYFSGTGKTSNNNNLRMGSTTGTVNCVGYYLANFVALANWQTANASAWDSQSKSVDPAYASPATQDYTPTNGLLNNAGAAVGVTNDITGASRSATTPDIGAYEFSVGGLDAAISWVSPTSPATVGLKTVTVNITNTQTIAINSLVLSYTPSGGTTVTETFSGLNIVGGSNQNISFTTQYNLLAGTSIAANIVSVNGGADQISANNVVTYNLCIGLSGTYTINSAVPTGGSNFQTFGAAVSALNCGIAGPVVFNVAAGSGPYNEQVIMYNVANTSSTNTITFNGNGCTLTYSSANSLIPSTLELQGTDWVRVNNLVISATGTTYAYAAHLWNQADNNIFSGCTFNTPTNVTGTVIVPFSISGSQSSATTSGASGNNNLITGCTMNGGYYNTCIVGNSAVNATGNLVVSCNLRDFYVYGLYTLYQNNLVFRSNLIDRSTRASSSNFYGIYLSTGSVGALVERNRLRNPYGPLGATSTLTSYCIYVISDGVVGNENKIYNNVVSDIISQGTIYGLYLSGADYIKVYHNTLSLEYDGAASGTVYGIYSSGTVGGMDIRNNNVSINRGGGAIKYGLYYLNGTGRISNNNNVNLGPNFFGSNYYGYYLGAYQTLANWQAGTAALSYDINSTSADPVFLDPTTYNYKPTSSAIDNTGAPLGITNDINNITRSLTTPDMGAYEFTLSPTDLGAYGIVNPVNGQCHSIQQTVTARIRNFGTQPLDFANNPATITVNVSGANSATFNTTINTGTLAVNTNLDVLMPGTFDMSTLGNYTFSVTATVTGDGDVSNDAWDAVTVTKAFNGGTAAGSLANHCASSPAPTVSLNGATGGFIQWQSSTVSASGPWTNVGTGATTYQSPSLLTQNTWYQAVYTCESLTATSNLITINVNNPQLASTTPATRCGAGTVTLSADASPYNTVWYSNSTTNAPAALTSSYTTPVIDQTTTYYAAASTGGGGTTSLLVGALVGGNGCGGGNMFNVTPNLSVAVTGFTMNLSTAIGTSTSVKLYYRVGTYVGNQASSAGWILHETVNVTSAGSNAPSVVTLANALNLNAGTQYAIYLYGSVNYTNITPPVTVSNADMTVQLGDGLCGEFSGNNVGRGFNGSIVYSTGCVGVRTPVVATVTPSTPIAASVDDNYVCAGFPVNLSVSSANSNYTYTWSSNPTGLTASGVSATASPVVGNNVYTVYGYDANDQCGAISTVNVTATPNLLSASIATPLASVCPGSNVALNLTAGLSNSVTDYSFTASSGTFTPLVGGTGIPTIQADDISSGSLPIGFTFYYEGVAYNNFFASSNGFIDLNAANSSTANNLTSGTPRPIIAPLWDDVDGASGTASYLTTGAPGNRVLTVEWLNWEWYYTVAPATISFQLKLYEANGKIEFIYRQESGLLTGASESASIGLAGAAANKFLSLNNPSASPVASSTVETTTINTRPATGQIYTFTPPTPSSLTYSWTGGTFTNPAVEDATAENVSTASTFNVLVTDLNTGCTKNANKTVYVNTPPSGFGFNGGPYCEGGNALFFGFGFPGSLGTPIQTSCNYTFVLTDSYGDGWNGATMEVRQGSTVVTTLGSTFTTGTSLNVPLVLSGNTPYTLYYVGAGTYASEVGIQIKDESNNVIYTLNAGAGTVGTTLYSWTTGTCSSSSSNQGTSVTYAWDGPNGFTSTDQNPLVTGLTAGNAGQYTMTVTDNFGCTFQAYDFLTVNDNPDVDYTTFTNETCPGYSDGTMEIGISGGDGSYSISDGGLYSTFGSPAQFSGVAPGSYFFSISDGNLCGTTTSITVGTEPNIPPVLVGTPNNISVNAAANACGANVNYTAPTATDNCPVGLGNVIQTAGLPSGSLFPVGTTVNTFSVTDAEGATVTSSFSVTVTDINAPAITNVPANISACNPVSWTVPTITDNCAGVITTSTHVPGTNFPSGTTTVTYTATDVYGNTSSASFNVTVLEPSTAATSVTSNRDFNNICSGENITLTVNGGSLGEQASWKWYRTACGGATNYVGQGTSVTVAPTVTTTYYVRAEGLCNTTVCQSITVTVSTGGPASAPVFSTLPTAAAPGVNSTVCVNPVPGATFYQWFTQNGHNQSILFNGQVGPIQTNTNCVNVSFVLPQQNYFIRVFAGNACGRTSQTNAAGIRGTVSASTCINGPTQVCPGQTLSYTACAIPSQTSVSYNWQIIPAVPGTATISFNGTNATVNYLPGFTTAQICVNGISTFGLAGPSYCINVSTNAPTPGAITGLSTPCEGSTQTYSIAAVPNATSYTWSSNIVGAVVTGNGTSATVVFPANVFAGDVCVVANSSCGVSAPSCISITSGQPGVPGAISGPVSGICNASNVNYSLVTSNANSYNWIVPAGVTISGPSNLNAVNLNFGAGFTGGTITVEAFYDCGSATSSITVDGAPDAPSLTPAVICPEASELYTASSTGATSYNWTLSGDDYSACTNPPTCSQYFVIWSVSGGSMSVTATNSCGTSTATTISGSSCRNEVGGLDSKVYPNPTNGKLFVEFRAQVAGEHNIFVTDLSGRIVFTTAIDANVGANLQEIDLSGANAGLYMVHVKDPKGTISVNKVGLE